MARETSITPEDIERNKVVAALSYLWILFIFYWLVDSRFVKFHAKQSLVIFLGDIILFIVGLFAGGIIPMWGLISLILRLLLFVLRVMGFVYAITGKTERLPVVADIAESLNL